MKVELKTALQIKLGRYVEQDSDMIEKSMKGAEDLMKKIEDDDRLPTEEEKETMKRYFDHFTAIVNKSELHPEQKKQMLEHGLPPEFDIIEDVDYTKDIQELMRVASIMEVKAAEVTVQIKEIAKDTLYGKENYPNGIYTGTIENQRYVSIPDGWLWRWDGELWSLGEPGVNGPEINDDTLNGTEDDPNGIYTGTIVNQTYMSSPGQLIWGWTGTAWSYLATGKGDPGSGSGSGSGLVPASEYRTYDGCSSPKDGVFLSNTPNETSHILNMQYATKANPNEWVYVNGYDNLSQTPVSFKLSLVQSGVIGTATATDWFRFQYADSSMSAPFNISCL